MVISNLKFFIWGGLSGLKFPFLENLDKHLLFEVNCTETWLYITDSLSHTTYVETNEKISVTNTDGLLLMTSDCEISGSN